MAADFTSKKLFPPIDRFVAVKELDHNVWLIIPRKILPKDLDRKSPSYSDVAALRRTFSVLKMSEHVKRLEVEDKIIHIMNERAICDHYVGTAIEETEIDHVYPEFFWLRLKALSGVSVANLVNRCGTPVPKEFLYFLFVKLYNALKYIHDNCGIVHVDVSANNILLVKDEAESAPDIRLIDFESAADSKHQNAQSMDAHGIMAVIGYIIDRSEKLHKIEFPDRRRPFFGAALAAFKHPYIDKFDTMEQVEEKWYKQAEEGVSDLSQLHTWIDAHIPEALATDEEIKEALRADLSELGTPT